MEWSKMSKQQKRNDILICTSFLLFLIGSLTISGVLFKVSHSYILFLIEEMLLVCLYWASFGYIKTFKY